MILALKERQGCVENHEPRKKLAEVLASRNVSETIRYCADYLGGVISRGNVVQVSDAKPMVSSRVASSFPKMIILKERGLPEHMSVLNEALSLIPLTKGVPERRLLAAKLMLAELDEARKRTLVSEHERRIGGMRLRVEGLLSTAEASLIALPSSILSSDRMDAEIEVRKNVLELKRYIDAIYALRSIGQDLPLVKRSLVLIASQWGSDDPKAENGDLGTLAAGAMLSGLGERYVCHSNRHTNIFLENRSIL